MDRSKVANLKSSIIGERKLKSNTKIYSSMNSGAVITNVSKGEIVKLYSAEGNWAEIETSSGIRGYIDRSTLTNV